MMNVLLRLAGLLIVLLCSFVNGQDTCTPDPEQPSCVCTLDQGNGTSAKIDLRSVGDANGKPRFTGISGGQNTYTYNPCYPYTDESAAGCTNVAACQVDIHGSARSVATQDGVTYTTDGTDIVISYTGGLDSRSALVTLQCGGSGTPDNLTFDGELEDLIYTFTLTSQCACPGKCNKDGPINGKSGGGENGGGVDAGVVGFVLISVFFFAVVVYFVAGMIIMRVKYNKTGSDVIPNKNFWFSLPSLVKDGVVFTISPCSKKFRSGYSNI